MTHHTTHIWRTTRICSTFWKYRYRCCCLRVCATVVPFLPMVVALLLLSLILLWLFLLRPLQCPFREWTCPAASQRWQSPAWRLCKRATPAMPATVAAACTDSGKRAFRLCVPLPIRSVANAGFPPRSRTFGLTMVILLPNADGNFEYAYLQRYSFHAQFEWFAAQLLDLGRDLCLIRWSALSCLGACERTISTL